MSNLSELSGLVNSFFYPICIGIEEKNYDTVEEKVKNN